MATDLGVKVTTEGKYYFISYNTEDADIVSRYVHALDRKGLPMWYDKGILVGDEWKEVIAKQIYGCEAVIMFLSNNVFKKEKSFVHKEWDIAKRRNKKVYLVILDHIDESNIPARYAFWWSDISSTQSVSALKYGFETCADMIIEAVGYVNKNETSIADGSDVNMKKNVNHDIPVEDNIDSVIADNGESNVAEFVDQSSADDFVIVDGVLKEYKGNSSVVRIPYGVTSIGENAFNFCSALKSIEIPDSVTSIGSDAFYYCSALTSVVIPDSVTSIGSSAFSDCYALTSVVIGNCVTSIGYSAFEDCYALTSMVIGKKVSSIGEHAFYDCDKLVEVINKSSLEINKGSEDYGYAGYYAFEIHQGESKIVNQDGYLFYTYNGVNYLLGYAGDDTALTLPESYNGQDYRIYEYAFCGNSSITSIVIPDSVTSIGDSAFTSCHALTSIEIPDSVKSIGSSAFYYCSALTSVVIGKKVSSIGVGAFGACNTLVEVINKSSLEINKRSKDYGYAGYFALEIHQGESKIVNQDGYLFYTYNGVNYLLGYTGDDTALTLPESYNGQDYRIYEYAFCGNSSITSIVIPDSVTSIGDSAFASCHALTSVVIGNGVTSIGNCAFQYCYALTSIVYRGTEKEWKRISFGVDWISKDSKRTLRFEP